MEKIWDEITKKNLKKNKFMIPSPFLQGFNVINQTEAVQNNFPMMYIPYL